MVGPLVRALWSTTRKSISASSSSPSSYLKPFLYARAAGISRSFSVATATAAANAAAPGGALDPSRLRNVAVIAHVDHGKTTLMDRLLRQCGADIPHERALDSNQLEKERGITIASKITSISWKENELNMVDTPGHADFGGEVERVVGMVEGAILVVDAGEGPLAQTKFVLAKALRYGLRPILLLNKVDRPSVSEERCDEVESLVFDLFANLGATEEQLDFPVLYASAKEGWASSTFTKNPPDDTKNMSQLLDAIVKYVPPPTANLDEPFQMLVSMMAKDDYVGRILTGRITSGVVRISDRVHGLHSTDSGVVKIEDGKVVKLRKNRGMISYDVDCAGAGDIISLAGLKSPSIGHTVANVEVMTALPTVELDPPTISMTFGVNDSPLAGLDGSQLTGGKIGDRLLAEAETNLAINVIPGLAESYEVQGRGELQLGILLENMRRENFELSVSPPKVMYKIEKGVKLEPIEEVTIEVNEEHVGLVMEALSHRRAGVTDMGPVPGNFGRSRMTLTCPSRGLVGYRSVFSSDTRGTGFMHRAFMAYEKYRGPLGNVRKGVLITSISWKDQLACLYHTRLIIFKYRPTCMFVSHKAYYLRHGCVEFTKNFHKVANSVRPVTTSVYHSNQQLNELWKSGRVSDAQYLFDEMPEKDEFTWNTMIAGYANSGKMIEAHKLFDATQNKSSITWSSLISGYCKLGFEFESIRLFCEMQYEGYKPSQFTLGSVLRMCSINGLLSTGEQIHGYAIKTQFDANVFVVTGLIDMYAQCKQLSEAKCLFATMSYGRNHVTWTAMITGYSRNQDQLGAIECYRDMRAEGVEANQYTFPSVLTACGEILAIRFGVQVHGCIVKGGFGANVFVASALVDMYAKCGSLNDAKIALVTMDVEDVVSWNSMIVGCVRQGFKWDALLLFKKMHTKNMKIDDFTYPSVLNCFVSLHDAKASKSVHCLAMKTGFGEYILVSNALVDMYAKRGELWCAFEVFNNMEEKDVVSWTSLVTGYTHNGAHEEALKLFCKMRISGIKPDQIVTASILSSCAELTVLDFGTQVHVSFIKSGFPSSLSVDNSLVTMYTNCGCIEDANKVFASMDIKNVITWTALIIGYAKNGKSKESLVFYNEMIKNGIKPDFITFIGLLFACSHAGLVDQARQYFDSMVNVYHIKPGPDHYACMIDLLGRSGKIHEAEELLNEMVIEPDATVWKALLSACRVHGKIELAEKAANTLFELEPQDAVPYVMLSNLYSSAGKWDDAARIRRLMKSRGVNKEPGYSWMEINSKVHSFMSEDRSHEKSNEIYSQINEVMMLIREAGYVPDMNFALHNIDEEGKELGLAYHSEKLAVAFGLLELPQGTPIRIYKNLRVCGDCHTAMKFISSVYSRIIILRDSNRFHHFREGVCSCGDYW